MSKIQRREKKNKKRLWNSLIKYCVEFQRPELFFRKKDGKTELVGVLSHKYSKDRRELRRNDISDLFIYDGKFYLKNPTILTPQDYGRNENGVRLAILNIIYELGETKKVGISLRGLEDKVAEIFKGEDGFDTDTYMVVKLLKQLVNHGIVTRSIFNTFWRPNTFKDVMSSQGIPIWKVTK